MTDVAFNVIGIGNKLTQAASTGRRLGSWGTRRAGPTTEVTQDLRVLVSRSRQLRRDNPWIGRALTIGTANEIGTGIKPSPNTGDPELDAQLKELWNDWIPHADYQGTLNAYGLQAACSIGRKEAGGCFLLTRRNRIDRLSENPVPLEFQLVETDQLAMDLTVLNYNSGKIINGIEMTKGGKIKAYWFMSEHPDENSGILQGASSLINRVRVPVGDVIHHFKPDRPGQLMGRPETVRAIIRAKNYDEYTDSELTRKKTRSDFTGVIERDPTGEGGHDIDPATGLPYEEDDAGVPMMDLEPGSFPSLMAGERIKMFDMDQTGQGFDEYQRWQLLAIAAATGVPYQLVTGDYLGINDRVWRAIFNNYLRELQQVQELYVIPQVCQKMWIEFVKRSVVAGVIKKPESMPMYRMYRCTHRTQAFEFIHPVQDVDSKIKLMQAGLKSRTAIVDEIGSGDESSISIDAQRAIDMAREEELGLASLANHSALSTVTEDVPEDEEEDFDNDNDDKEDKE